MGIFQYFLLYAWPNPGSTAEKIAALVGEWDFFERVSDADGTCVMAVRGVMSNPVAMIRTSRNGIASFLFMQVFRLVVVILGIYCARISYRAM